MVQLICRQKELDSHYSAFHDGVMKALEALASAQVVPWKPKRKPILSDVQRKDPAVMDFFGCLRDEERADGALLKGDSEKMLRVIASAGPKYARLPEDDQKACKKVLEQVLPYEMFQVGRCWRVDDGKIVSCGTAWRGSEYIKRLGVVVCPYCNASSLPLDVTVPFDHYLQKEDYPYLRLCLLNLIPVCSHCNWPRKNFPVHDFMQYAYPYRDVVHDETRFLFEQMPIGDEESQVHLLLQKRKPSDPDRSRIWLESLGIRNLYERVHVNDIQWIREQSDLFRETYRDSLAGMLGRPGMEATYRRYFKCSFNRGKINKESLSKLTIDLVEALNPEMIS